MGIFGNNKRSTVPALVMDDEQPDGDEVNYNTVLDWLVGLSDEDYSRVNSIAAIYRAANKQACEVLGVDCEPTSHITEPEPVVPEKTQDEIDDDFLNDELNTAFLEDEPKKPAQKPKE